MSFTALHPANAAKPAAPYSPAMDTGNVIFFSGQIALTPDGGFINDSLDAELTQVFSNIDALLAAGNIKKSNIAKVVVYLDSLDYYAAVNERYGKYFEGITSPARSCFEVAKLPMGAKVEIEVVAVR